MFALPHVQATGLSCYRALARPIDQLAQRQRGVRSFAYLVISDYLQVAKNYSLSPQQREELVMNGIFSIMDLCDKHEYVAAAAHHHCGRLAHQRRARLPAGTHQFCVAALHSGPNRQGDVQGPARPLPEQVQVQGQDLSRLPLQRQPAHVATHTRAHRRSNLCTQKRESSFLLFVGSMYKTEVAVLLGCLLTNSTLQSRAR